MTKFWLFVANTIGVLILLLLVGWLLTIIL